MSGLKADTGCGPGAFVGFEAVFAAAAGLDGRVFPEAFAGFTTESFLASRGMARFE